ncbi:MAG: hypothetical protein AAGM67_10910 [Bacteroidota bacterium]
MKFTTAPYKVLVAGLIGEKDFQGNPIQERTQFEQQIIYPAQKDNFLGFVEGSPAASTGTLTILDNDFSTGRAILELGIYELVAGEDFLVGAAATDTATNLAALISLLPGYTAVAAGADVNIEGPKDLQEEVFKVLYEGTIQNYDLVPVDGVLTPNGLSVQGPRIT